MEKECFIGYWISVVAYGNLCLFYALKDNINLFDYNVHERVNDFVAAALSQVS